MILQKYTNMKTYILDTVNRIKRFSESIDVSTLLCNKQWVVFNDTGEKQSLIFKSNGSLIITTNGVGFETKWNWISANKSLTINEKNLIVLLHPSFVNKTILALQLDGTNQYTFLIDNNNKSFVPRTLSELDQYFIDIEKKEEQKEKNKQKQNEKKRIQARHQYFQMKAKDIAYPKASMFYIFIIGVVCTIPIILSIKYFIDNNNNTMLYVIIALISISILIFYFIIKLIGKTNAKKHIKEHPNDPINKYLKKYLYLYQE